MADDSVSNVINLPEVKVTGNRGSLPSWLTGVPGAAVSGIFSLLSAYEQRHAAERIMEKQRQWQLDDWLRQNDYNSPAAVMARMASAGLNPDLLVGGNNSSAAMPGQGSVPGLGEANGIDTSGFQLAAQARLNNAILRGQSRLLNAQARGVELENEEKDDIANGNENSRNFNVQSLLAGLKIKLHEVDSAEQNALASAIDNFSKGYKPRSDSKYYDVYEQMQKGYTLITNLQDRYKIDSYTRQRLDKIFELMCQADEAKLQKEINDFQTDSKVQEWFNGDKWYQVLGNWLRHMLKELLPVANTVLDAAKLL